MNFKQPHVCVQNTVAYAYKYAYMCISRLCLSEWCTGPIISGLGPHSTPFLFLFWISQSMGLVPRAGATLATLNNLCILSVNLANLTQNSYQLISFSSLDLLTSSVGPKFSSATSILSVTCRSRLTSWLNTLIDEIIKILPMCFGDHHYCDVDRIA